MMEKDIDNMSSKNDIYHRFILELTPGDYCEEATDDRITDCLNLIWEAREKYCLKLTDNEPEGVRYILVKNMVGSKVKEYLVEIELSGGKYRKFFKDEDIIMEILWNYIDDERLPDLSDWMDVSDEIQ
ncbi:MAG: hypothetical protein Q4Q07_05645 [Tissierellia bacterium]|nr:hypothetical protein [Tissierellia bacterium]